MVISFFVERENFFPNGYRKKFLQCQMKFPPMYHKNFWIWLKCDKNEGEESQKCCRASMLPRQHASTQLLKKKLLLQPLCLRMALRLKSPFCKKIQVSLFCLERSFKIWDMSTLPKPPSMSWAEQGATDPGSIMWKMGLHSRLLFQQTHCSQ